MVFFAIRLLRVVQANHSNSNSDVIFILTSEPGSVEGVKEQARAWWGRSQVRGRTEE